MKRAFLALTVALLLLLVAGVGTAAAEPPASQGLGQWAESQEDAGAAAGAAQQEPTDESGTVSQSNEAASGSAAGNANESSQSAEQDQGACPPQEVMGPDGKTCYQPYPMPTKCGTSGEVQLDGKTCFEPRSTRPDPRHECPQSCSGGEGLQGVGQSADSEQDATALSATEQEKPSNENVSVRVLSPGDDGSVSQSNEASSEATAGNANLTEQNADQTQAGGSGLQGIGQSADSEQDATAIATTEQEEPSNSNISVRVLSPGDGGDVWQSNDASSEAEAGNINLTGQHADQTQAGGGNAGEQVIGQSADNDQDATALAATKQEKPSNSNISVRVLSPGDDGDVRQSNEASSKAEAGNLNVTKQTADQTQAGDSCKCGNAGEQFIGQSADNDQDATALAATKQEKPSNSNISVRVLSPGDGGDVKQSNEASSKADAGNLNLTEQKAEQSQEGDSCKCGSGLQVIAQSAKSEQDAAAIAATIQEKPSNTNAPIRVLSKGDDGDVWQSNEASSKAEAGNLNLTEQKADQSQAGGSGLQVIGQEAKNDQDAFALGLTVQKGAENENEPLRVLSKGDSGDVWQSNEASSKADAGNLNLTEQKAEQSQEGDSCKCGSGLQVIAQSAKSEQDAAAIAATIQEKPSNTNAPIRVLSKGDDGDVWQSNEASSKAEAGNLNLTEQKADQSQAGGSGLQVIGQEAKNDQDAFALGLTIQKGAENENEPLRVLSKGDSGDVWQSNEASSKADAGNLNLTEQKAEQSQEGDSCKCGSGLQVIAQSAKSEQDAAAIAATIQEKPSNTNAPIRVLSKGDDGDVWQSNEASSKAEAGNLNLTEQKADQSQAGGSGLQVIGQEAKNDQDAFALGLTVQKGAENENEPLRVLSKGDSGDVWQSNEASSKADAGNLNLTEQKAEQSQEGDSCKCGSGLQVIAQSAKNHQGAVALAATLQLGLRQPCKCQDDSKFGNSNEPTRVLSKGNDGAVRQANVATSDATALNWNETKQVASQIQTHPCRCKAGDGIQVIGQLDVSKQFAVALAATLQLDPSNTSAPDRKESPGKKSPVSQKGMDAARDGAGGMTATDQSRHQVEGR